MHYHRTLEKLILFSKLTPQTLASPPRKTNSIETTIKKINK